MKTNKTKKKDIKLSPPAKSNELYTHEDILQALKLGEEILEILDKAKSDCNDKLRSFKK